MNSDEDNSLVPYNSKNISITIKDLLKIFRKYGVKKIFINDLSLYQQAMVHKSYVKPKVKRYLEKNKLKLESFEKDEKTLDLFEDSNEKMEFLGDSILGTSVVSYLYRRFPDSDEGFMTKLKSRLVRSETLGMFSQKIGLDKFLVISDHVENNCDGRSNIRILEDLFEAFIAAVFLDQGKGKKTPTLLYGPGYNYCETFIFNLIEQEIDFEKLIQTDENYKDKLIKYFNQHFHKKPKFITMNNGNLDEKIYNIGVIDNDTGTIIGQGKGKTKKKAEQEAAKDALENLTKK